MCLQIRRPYRLSRLARQYSRNDSTSIFSCSCPESFRGRIFSCCSSSTTLTDTRSENADQLSHRTLLFHRITVAEALQRAESMLHADHPLPDRSNIHQT